jgi:hypothetical protein
MGYDAHITRRKSWADTDGPEISEQEWLAHAADDPELASLFWNGGNIDAKNPDGPLVRRMVSAAAALGATVQGDDGESYDAAGNAVQPPPPGVLTRIASWIANRTSAGAEAVDASTLPFKVGDRVRNAWGHFGNVTEIDVRAERGLGRVTVRYEDGRVLSSTAVAHGLERADA